ncbi:MAG: methyltransferase domain-containing protein [Microlunatus sp.]|nr:methyltransferase domain-containing protein [Microlunatus sp.]
MTEQERPAGWHDQERIQRWIAGAQRREAQMIPVSAELFAAADLRPGESVLDVGCGTGPTTVAAAQAVGRQGRVVGIDLSPQMIDTARERSGVDGPDAGALEWRVADAQTYGFGAEAFDAVISRFGLMFFSDPVAAFANLAQATRPGGRLAAVVWQIRDRAPIFAVPYRCAQTVLDRCRLPYTPVAIDDNQCSLGTVDRVERVLAPAGWRDIAARPTEQSLYLGGPVPPETAAETMLDTGPIRGLLEGRSADVVAEVRAEILAEFSRHYDGTGVRVSGGFMVVTARR